MSGFILESGISVGFRIGFWIKSRGLVPNQLFESRISCQDRVSWLNSNSKVKSLIKSWDHIPIWKMSQVSEVRSHIKCKGRILVWISGWVSRSRPKMIIWSRGQALIWVLESGPRSVISVDFRIRNYFPKCIF